MSSGHGYTTWSERHTGEYHGEVKKPIAAKNMAQTPLKPRKTYTYLLVVLQQSGHMVEELIPRLPDEMASLTLHQLLAAQSGHGE